METEKKVKITEYVKDIARKSRSYTETSGKFHWLAPASFLIFIIIALILRISFVDLAEYPGHGDYAFYFTVAENIFDGKGFQTDYIWTYLSNPKTITHTSHDFWMPLTSLLISISFFLFGKSMPAALVPSIFTGLALSIVVFFLARKITNSKFVAYSSAVLVLFMPYLFSRSLLTDSPIFYVLGFNS